MQNNETIIRSANRHDVESLVNVVGSMESPAAMMGPLCRYSSVEDLVRSQFRAPYGVGGYRYTTLLEHEGMVSAFVVCMPLDKVVRKMTALLPEAILAERFGDRLDRVLHISLIGVMPHIRRRKYATMLCSKVIMDAAKRDFQTVMGQAWTGNLASAELMLHYGFERFYEADVQDEEGTGQRFVFFDKEVRTLVAEYG